MTLRHNFVSGKSDGSDASLVQASYWNADHLVDANGINMVAGSTDPSTPTAGNIAVYGKTVAGYGALKWTNSSNEDTMVQSHLGQDKVVWSTVLGNSTTVPSVWGIPAWTGVGTTTARNWASTNLLTRQKRLGYVSVATAGGISQLYQTVAQTSLGNGSGLGGFLTIFRFGVSDAAAVSGARMFVGMTSSVAALTNVEPNTLTNAIGVAQLSSSNNLQIVYGGTSIQTIDLGANFPANTLSTDSYELVLYAPSNTNNTCGYKVSRLGTSYVAEGILTAATPGTQLPATTTPLVPRLFRCNNTTAAAVGLDFVSYYCQTDY